MVHFKRDSITFMTQLTSRKKIKPSTTVYSYGKMIVMVPLCIYRAIFGGYESTTACPIRVFLIDKPGAVIVSMITCINV